MVRIRNCFGFSSSMTATTTMRRRMKRSFLFCYILASLFFLLPLIALAQESSSSSVDTTNATIKTTTAGGESQSSSCSATDETCTAATPANVSEETTNESAAPVAAADALGDGEEEAVEETIANGDTETGCVDLAEDCQESVDYGECEINSDYMQENCRKSCQMCFDDANLNLKRGEDLGVIQNLEDSHRSEILARIVKARDYIRTKVYQEKLYKRVRRVCRNQDSGCAFWSALGECEENPAYMNISCAPMCQTCEWLDIRTRCPLDPTIPNIWQPGDLNKLFERLTTQPEFQTYEPKVWSRPDYLPYDTAENATYKVGPWLITMENVVLPEEAKRMIELGAEEGYERSSDVGGLKFDGTHESLVNDGRTSTNAWCAETCYADPLAKAVIDRIENITEIPDNYTEHLQLLRYEVGQYYQTHHDYIEYEVEEPDGVRILTLYIYLNDVEEGGGTNFPHLNITVMPKLGRAVMWPSVLNDDPHAIDQRTEHQALPVEKGIKYGANAWFHQRDFKTPHAQNCLP